MCIRDRVHTGYVKVADGLLIKQEPQLGQGAYGTVYEGLWQNETCAVKIVNFLAAHMALKIHAGTPNDKAYQYELKSFNRECECLQLVDHKNVVKLLKVCEMSNFPVIVMELLNCNLGRYLSSCGDGIDVSIQLSLSCDVASGLDYLHKNDILHRDLCGDNILLKLCNPIPVAKISDFGTSKLIDEQTRAKSFTKMLLLREGYFPPELETNPKSYDFSIDIFMFGVVMVQIIHSVGCIEDVKHRTKFVEEVPQDHPLKTLISMCIDDKEKRPKADEVASEIKTVCVHGNEH